MDQRYQEIAAAVDLLLQELDRVRPSSCQAAVEMNWRIRKLAIARGLILDAADRPASLSRREKSPPARRAGLPLLNSACRVE